MTMSTKKKKRTKPRRQARKTVEKKYKIIPTVLSKSLKFFNMNFIRLIKLRFSTRSSEKFMQISHLKGLHFKRSVNIKPFLKHSTTAQGKWMPNSLSIPKNNWCIERLVQSWADMGISVSYNSNMKYHQQWACLDFLYVVGVDMALLQLTRLIMRRVKVSKPVKI